MTITVNTPDGGTAEFPDGTDPGTITSAMKAKFGGPDSKSGPSVDDSALGQAGNFLYRGVDTGLMHAPDYALAGLHAIERGTGYDPNATDLDQIRAQNDQYASMHPIQALTADVAGYGLGFGKLGLAAKGAEFASGLGAGARVAQGVGAAGEGAIAGGLGAATSGESVGDSLKSAALGAGAGGVLGAAAGGARTAPPAARSVADLTADEAANYARLKTMPVTPTFVNQGIAKALQSLDPGEISGLSDKFEGQLGNVIKQVNSGAPLSANDMNSMARQLGNAQRGGTDSIAGARIGEVLRSFYSDPQADARLASAKVKDMGWLTDPDLTPAEKVAQAKSNINDPGMLMDDPTRAAMTNLANAGPNLFQRIVQPVVNAGISHGVNAAVGHTLGGALGDAALGGILGVERGGGIGGKVASVVGSRIPGLNSNAAIKRAIKAAQAATSTGQTATPGMYRSPWPARGAQAALQGVYGVGAAGQ